MKKLVCILMAGIMILGISVNPALAYKPRVTVYGFESKASSGFWHDFKWDVGTGMAEMLVDALVNSGKVEVVERLNLTDITTEQDLMTGGRVSKKSGAKTGQLKGAEYIVRGTITEFDYRESGGNLGLTIKGFNLGGKTSEAHIAGIIRIYDATTGEIYTSKRFEKKVPSSGLTVGYYHKGIGGTLGGFKKTPLGKATHLAIADMTDYIVSALPSSPVVQELQCSKCGAMVPEGEKFCPKCGADMSLRAPDECPKCGIGIPAGTKFCANCGTQIAGVTCPDCGKKLAAGTNFCPYCGGKTSK
ncbi:MAG: zinc ribbon domain-containing protein [Candidatus Omnitrophica bacterium]|nr:zinc ribbon domain-containing protein [Candidatus Omnitrophota bacterium]